MKKRLAASLSLALLSAAAPLASAAGLGDITLYTGLNEPLRADIRVRNVGDLNENQLLVNLADREAFERAGVDRVFFLSGMDFELELTGDGDAIVRVSTEQPVKEPYLEFVVELKWPTGRVLREYTLLLDLPLFTEEPPRAAPAASAPRAPRQAPVTPAQAPAYEGSSYRVRRGDTLWGIASRVKPADLSVQQTMVALQRINPEAFVDGNINRLRAGQDLRIPTRGDIADLNEGEAIREVRDQIREWSAEAAPAAETGRDGRADGVLVLGGGDADTGAAAGGLGGEGGAAASDLQARLVAQEEELAAKERQIAEMEARVRALEEQVDTAEVLLQIRSEELAAVEAGVTADAEPPIAEEPADAATTEETQTDYTYADAEGADEPDAAEPEEAETPPARPAAPPPAPEPSLIDRLLDNILVIGGALAALIALVLFVLFRRRGAAEPDERELPPLYRDEVETPPVDDDVAAIDDVPEDSGPRAASYTESADEYDVEPAEEEDATEFRAETEDALAEAEIYLAYGRSDAAVELLLRALEDEPERSDLRLKLMEIYVDNDEEQGFLAQYGALEAAGDHEAIGEAKGLLSGTGQLHWLREAVEDEQLDVGEPDTLVDADVSAEPPPAPEGADERRELDVASELDELGTLDLDADLDLDDEDLDAGSDAELEGAPDDDELELDADLGSGENEIPPAVPVEEPMPATGGDADDDLDLLDESDEVGTKLELARAYIDMGDVDGARDILDEVIAEGDDEQRALAQDLRERLS